MHLERWMVDEIIDDDVRVLRTALRARSADELGIETALGAAGRVEAPAELAIINRELALRLEAEPVAIWTGETEAHFERGPLTAFLIGGARRTAAAGLPVRNDLREGDVYWVMDPAAVADGRRAAHDLGTDQTPALIGALEGAGAEIWDVTAAARQVMKRVYGYAAIARTDGPPAPEGGGGG
jgi:hypothetical protein